MTADIESIVIGAGVVGLAVARALAVAGHETMVLEQHELIGSETSSRNSEVIHAGIDRHGYTLVEDHAPWPTPTTAARF